MKHDTYEIHKRAHLGIIDRDGLSQSIRSDPDSFASHYAKLLLQQTDQIIHWTITPFTSDFLSASPRERLDETVITFILHLASIVKQESYRRSFSKPETFDIFIVWVEILKSTIYAILSLLYNITWTDKTIFDLDLCVIDLLHHVKPTAFRDFMQSVGIKLAGARANDLYLAERLYDKMCYLHVGQFSGFYWRLLHWMAEAMVIQKEHDYAKQTWTKLLLGPLYRTIRCGSCMGHFISSINEVREQLLKDTESYPEIFFKMHNKVHAIRREAYHSLLNEPDYSEDDYKKDAEFMRQALL